ncbi:MAG: AAA family ATPase [Thermoplasmata archaeon]|nr:AAA family ATPase [Thermoplasmata archaeon]
MRFKRLYGYNPKTLERIENSIIIPLNDGGFDALSPGYLFFGPPGTGKTAVIESIATEARGKMRFIRVKIVDMMMSSSTPERFKESMDKIFERAKKAMPSFIYLDKPERIESSGVMDEMPVRSVPQAYVAEKMREIRGKGICLLLEVQDPHDLDTALFGPGRVEDMFYFDYPNEERLRTIISRHLSNKLKRTDLHAAVSILRGLSPADVETMIRKGNARAGLEGRGISLDDLEWVRRSTSLFVNDRLAGNVSRFWRSYGAISPPERLSWDIVIGLETVKREFTRIERILKDKKFADKFGLELPKGLLLYGPPGCGKTMITRIMGARLGIHFIHQSASELHSTYWGEAKNKVKGLFSEAERKSPSLIFLDDIDTLKSRHIPGESGAALSEIITQILYELDSIRARRSILFISATNLPWEMDEALMRPGRIDKKLYVPPPDAYARKRLFEMYLSGKPYGKIDLNHLPALTENYSGADIREVCSMAAEELADIYIEKGRSERITMDRMLKIIRNYKPSINPSFIRAYDQFSRKTAEPGRYIG